MKGNYIKILGQQLPHAKNRRERKRQKKKACGQKRERIDKTEGKNKAGKREKDRKKEA